MVLLGGGRGSSVSVSVCWAEENVGWALSRSVSVSGRRDGDGTEEEWGSS